MRPELFHWPRHGWVRLGDGWVGHLRSPLASAERAEVADWCAAGRPLVIARRRSEDEVGELRLGLATPDKRRIGLHVAVEAVTGRLPPLPLAEAVDAAPALWRPMLTDLARRAEELGTAAAVYGSLAWQQRTGLPYVRPESDVDLLFAPCDRWQLDRLLELLAELGDGNPRLDGEILLPDGATVAWRELAGRPARLLVKGTAEVGLRDLASVLALFDREEAA
ncbi:malonate decarboxylase holo-[acyl-carrier-protein] synthase [Azospirillum melinis]|uniref:Malonate decarboxylase holo-[acyl-carrier-protein] synthase n=1 Tax=Azospirillum melinis TaxID=328839 RepID=A0ABX2KE79_9PROT|nr:malonate decarboxylase holo-[acyl-carrier-protein] synthase [Azospirillum melinis]MBP2306524.1 phosphoribosyl-dephospho-CoA transferase [Azospirillum melinis]NUA98118.1 malonate decarboxylase holo-[acyl-carrier-protein] synthase [Azospirillum melinis]